MPRACNIPPHLLAFCGSAQPQSGPAVPTSVARGDKAGRPWTSTKWRKRAALPDDFIQNLNARAAALAETTGGHPHRSIRSATASSHAWCENRRPTVFEEGDRIVLMGLTERPE